jgi:hypothetical protein
MKIIPFRKLSSWQHGFFRFSLILALFVVSLPASLASEPTLALAQTNGSHSVSWTASGFVLESIAAVNGTWAPVSPTPTSPYTLPVGGSTSQFYRLREEAATVTHVTVQGYTNDASGGFIAAGDPLVYEVKAGCQTWTREAKGGGMDTISGPHTHYNAATDVTFVGGTITWTEYGPAHSQAEIDTTCAAGTGGVVKTANESSYTEHQPGLFLRVSSTTNSTTNPPPVTTNTITHVTVQGYTNDALGGFIAAGEPLVYEVKAGCQTWTREARGGGMDTISGPHTHYNAATDVTFVGGTITWTEYGPAHSQAEIDATCAAGTGGVVKTANDSSYTEHQPGLFLRVTSTE